MILTSVHLPFRHSLLSVVLLHGTSMAAYQAGPGHLPRRKKQDARLINAMTNRKRFVFFKLKLNMKEACCSADQTRWLTGLHSRSILQASSNNYMQPGAGPRRTCHCNLLLCAFGGVQHGLPVPLCNAGLTFSQPGLISILTLPFAWSSGTLACLKILLCRRQIFVRMQHTAAQHSALLPA